MRKLAATYIFPGGKPPLKNGLLICDDDGTVIELQQKGKNLREEAGVEFYSGALVPGFVNAHCHLELSHLAGKLEGKTGLGGFLGQINQLRHSSEETITKAMQVADRRMWAAGIAAVGDISNSAISLEIKLKSNIAYHTFVEVFGFHPSRAERAFEKAAQIKSAFQEYGLKASIVPHAAYSVSDPLFKKLKIEAEESKSIVSFHNQESGEEEQLFKVGSGPIRQHLEFNIGLDVAHWNPTGESSLQSVLKYLPRKNKMLLVHNTFTEETDLAALFNVRRNADTFFVLCPNANLFIEDSLPPIGMFRESGLNICLGTDSLASNYRLSMVDEMRTVQQNFPEMSLEELVDWSCINGAMALEMDEELGSFEKGKKPGVNLLTGLDLRKLRLTERTGVKRLL